MRTILCMALAAGLATGCYGPDPNLTETGKGKPEVTVDFPATVEAGSVQDLVITVTNPGPGDMTSLFIAFANVGVGGEVGVPNPLIPPAAGKDNPVVMSVDPRPDYVGSSGVYKFGGLAEGDTTSVTFVIRVPSVQGTLANSVQAYDGQEPVRARGSVVETEVTD